MGDRLLTDLNPIFLGFQARSGDEFVALQNRLHVSQFRGHIVFNRREMMSRRRSSGRASRRTFQSSAGRHTFTRLYSSATTSKSRTSTEGGFFTLVSV